MTESGMDASESDLRAGADKSGAEPIAGLGEVFSEYGEYARESLEIAQLRGQVLVLSLIKMLVMTLAALVLGISGWLLLMFFVVQLLLHFGAPTFLAALLVAFLNVLCCCYSWRRALAALRSLRITAPTPADTGVAADVA